MPRARFRIAQVVALALTGWYLMTPPINKSNDSFEPAYDAPLSQWTIVSAFDTAAECQRAKPEQIPIVGETISKFPKTNPPAMNMALVKAAASATCIATDDPRLRDR
jgi:hypothetical protein